MIAIDTNVLMQFLIRDDADQYEIAADLVKACTLDEPGFICREVILELVWVLERSYKFNRSEVADTLIALISSTEFLVEASDDIASIIPLYQNEGFGFANLMIRQAAHLSGAKVLNTFDQKLAKLSGVDLLGTTH
jgi:predicted nucleic-acid-binding protein